MAFLHRTWTFDPVAAHRAIAARVVDDGVVQIDRLIELAGEVVREADAATTHYLEMARYDEEWLDDEDPFPWKTDLYVACLGPHLRPAAHIDAPLLLVRFLNKRRGWPKEKAWEVLAGAPLSTLPLDDPLMALVRPSLTLQFGGWMSSEFAANVLAWVEDEGEDGAVHGLDSSDMAWLNKRLERDADEARAILDDSYKSALTVLTLLEREPPGTALRCIAD